MDLSEINSSETTFRISDTKAEEKYFNLMDLLFNPVAILLIVSSSAKSVQNVIFQCIRKTAVSCISAGKSAAT